LKEKTEDNANKELEEEAIEQLKRLFMIFVSLVTSITLLFFGGNGILAVFMAFITGSIHNTLYAYCGMTLLLVVSVVVLYIAHKILKDFYFPLGHRFIDVGTKRAMNNCKND